MPHHTASQVQAGHSHTGDAHTHTHSHHEPDSAADTTQRQRRMIRQWRTARVLVQLILLAIPASAIYVIGWTGATIALKLGLGALSLVSAAALTLSLSRSLVVRRLIDSKDLVAHKLGNLLRLPDPRDRDTGRKFRSSLRAFPEEIRSMGLE